MLVVVLPERVERLDLLGLRTLGAVAALGQIGAEPDAALLLLAVWLVVVRLPAPPAAVVPAAPTTKAPPAAAEAWVPLTLPPEVET